MSCYCAVRVSAELLKTGQAPKLFLAHAHMFMPLFNVNTFSLSLSLSYSFFLFLFPPHCSKLKRETWHSPHWKKSCHNPWSRWNYSPPSWMRPVAYMGMYVYVWHCICMYIICTVCGTLSLSHTHNTYRGGAVARRAHPWTETGASSYHALNHLKPQAWCSKPSLYQKGMIGTCSLVPRPSLSFSPWKTREGLVTWSWLSYDVRCTLIRTSR